METKSPPLIYARIAAVMGEIDAISKDRNNTQQNYKFRGIDDAYNTLHSPLVKHKVFYTSEVLKQENSLVPTKSGGTMQHSRPLIRYTFYTEDGSSISTDAVGEAMDSGDKAEGKAQSYALKVALMQLFCIPTEDQKDTEYGSPEMGNTLTSALGEVLLAESSEQVNQLWNVHAVHQTNERFAKLVGQRMKQLQPKAAA